MALNARAKPNYVPISEANAFKHLLKLSQNFSEPTFRQEALSENTECLLFRARTTYSVMYSTDSRPI